MDDFITNVLLHTLSFVVCVPVGIYLAMRTLRKRIDSVNT